MAPFNGALGGRSILDRSLVRTYEPRSVAESYRTKKVKENDMKVFVLMPFAEEFDDVYHIIKDSTEVVCQATRTSIECYRADDIDEPGKISSQVLAAIRSADLIVAELTGSNPNVMYELGFAHALDKATIILNQAVHNSPFDVKDFRQITYDRTRLLKDCRPSLVASITAVVQRAPVAENSLSPPTSKEVEGTVTPAATVLVRPGPALIMEVQKILLELRFLKNTKDRDGAIKQGHVLLELLGKISVIGPSDSEFLRNAIGAAGNCGVILEQFDIPDLPEKIYRKAIGLMPDYEGVHIQYSDLLADQGRLEEAREELNKAKTLAPKDPRLGPLETKIALGSGSVPRELGQRLKEDFYSSPSDARRAAAYMLYLSEVKDTAEFERTAEAWAAAGKDQYGPRRALADYLASSREDDDMRRAIQIYRDLGPICPHQQRAAMLHNLATLLYHFDLDEEAESTWRAAYALEPNNFSIQSSFSQFLDRKGDLESARLVTRGEPLPAA